jgi:hypothetical protein
MIVKIKCAKIPHKTAKVSLLRNHQDRLAKKRPARKAPKIHKKNTGGMLNATKFMKALK